MLCLIVMYDFNSNWVFCSGGRLGHAINAGVLAFMVVSSASFAMCATDLNRKYELIRQAMSIKGIKPAEERKSPDSP